MSSNVESKAKKKHGRGAPCPVKVRTENGEHEPCGHPILCKGMCQAHLGRKKRADDLGQPANMSTPVRVSDGPAVKLDGFRVSKRTHDEVLAEARERGEIKNGKPKEYGVLKSVVTDWADKRRDAREAKKKPKSGPATA